MKKAKENTVSYIAKTVVWSLQHAASFQPGEVITWDLDGENVPDFQALQNLGVIEPPGEPKEIIVQEVANGEDSFSRPASDN